MKTLSVSNHKRHNEIVKRNVLVTLRRKTPTVYKNLIAKLNARRRASKATGLGFSWGEFGENLFNDVVDAAQRQNVHDREREIAEFELQRLREQNAARERQLALQNENLAMRTRDNVFEAFARNWWAIPSLVGLTGALIYVRKKRK